MAACNVNHEIRSRGICSRVFFVATASSVCLFFVLTSHFLISFQIGFNLSSLQMMSITNKHYVDRFFDKDKEICRKICRKRTIPEKFKHEIHISTNSYEIHEIADP